LPETDSHTPFVYRYECVANHEHLKDTVEKNSETNERILKILQGNGEGGLIWKVNSLMMRNQWIDKGFAVILSIASTLITLYLTGALNL